MLFRKISISFLIFFSFVAVANAQMSASQFGEKISLWATGLQGKVVIEKGVPEVAFAKPSGVVSGMVFEVRREGEKLKHPVSGANLGSKILNIGEAKLDKVSDKSSTAIFNTHEGFKIEKDDDVILQEPIMLDIHADNFTNELDNDLHFAIFKNRNLLHVNKSDYIIKCSDINKENVSECSLTFKNKVIFSEKVKLDDLINIRSLNHSGEENEPKFVRKPLNYDLVSVAIGHPEGSSGAPQVAAADVLKIYLFDIDNQTDLKEIATGGDIEYERFDLITNIEFFDVDGDGNDELLVSNILDNKASSYIFKHEKDGSYNKILAEIEGLFRTYHTGGSRKLVFQNYGDGAFSGVLYDFRLVNGKAVTTKIDNTLGLRLYGFGMGKFIEGKSDEIVSFNKLSQLTVADKAGSQDTYETYFGDTPHKIIYSRSVKLGEEKIDSSNRVPLYDTRIIGFPIYQRIIEIAPGMLFFINNIPVERKSVGITEYNFSYLGVYRLIGNITGEVWRSRRDFAPTLYEADVIEKDGRKILVVLGNSEKAMGSNDSFIYILSSEK